MSRYDYKKKQIGEHYYGTRQGKKKSKVWRVFVFLLFFALIVALFIYVFPEVEVTIVPETETKVNDLNITIDGNLTKEDLVNNKMPGEMVDVDGNLKKTFKTSGEKNVGDKASGEVVFYNQTGLVQPLTTLNSLVSDDGVVFFLKGVAEIPKAEVSAEGTIVYGTLVAQVEAKEAGEEGNINPGRLTIIDLAFSKQNKIYGEVKTRLEGGTSKVIKVVSQDDLDKAEKTLRESLEPELKSKIEDRLSESQVLYDDLINFEVINTEKAVELEEEIEEFEMKIEMTGSALVWDGAIVRDMIARKIESEVDENKKIVETSRDVFEVEVESVDISKALATLKIHAENQVSLPIYIDKIKDELKGLTEFEARRLLLERDNIKDVRFKFSYSVTNKIPENGNRINVLLNFR